jgi:hypothetical protein
VGAEVVGGDQVERLVRFRLTVVAIGEDFDAFLRAGVLFADRELGFPLWLALSNSMTSSRVRCGSAALELTVR